MSPKVVFAVAAAALSLSAGGAFAESEGNGNPFQFKGGYQVTAGRPFVADTGSAAYPAMTGNTTQPSSLARLEPVVGSEAAVQTAGSLPRGFGNGSVARAQAQSLDRYLVGHSERKRQLDAGVGPFRS